jgi:hypothetical protein
MGPETFEANVSITGGMLVEPDGTTQKVKPAAADSLVWLGVALYDALPAGTSDESTIHGFPALNAATPRSEVAVAWHGVVKLKFAAAASFGQVCYPAANGEVDVTVAGRAVGQCLEKAGVASGAYGLVRLF